MTQLPGQGFAAALALALLCHRLGVQHTLQYKKIPSDVMPDNQLSPRRPAHTTIRQRGFDLLERYLDASTLRMCIHMQTRSSLIRDTWMMKCRVVRIVPSRNFSAGSVMARFGVGG